MNVIFASFTTMLKTAFWIALGLSTGAILPSIAGPAHGYGYQLSSNPDIIASSSSSAVTSTSTETPNWIAKTIVHQKGRVNIRGSHSKYRQVLTSTLQELSTISTYKSTILPPGIPKCYGGIVTFTQYWVSKENSWDETNAGQRVWLGLDKSARLLTIRNETIAFVSQNTHKKCSMEGTCLLNDGRLVNIDRADTFKVIGTRNRANNLFGYGSRKQNLVPFVSIASNDLPYGQKLFLPQLNGTRLPNGKIHNGCVRVDDESSSFGSCQMDLFVVSYANYLDMDFEPIFSISFEDCKILNYATEGMLRWVEADSKALSKVLDDKRQDWEDWMLNDDDFDRAVFQAKHVYTSSEIAYLPTPVANPKASSQGIY